jgi:L-amino acid N-acyltransferase YncA
VADHDHVSAVRRSVEAFRIRKASVADVGGIVNVLQTVASERVHSAIEQPWPVEQQRKYLESLSAREAFHVAADASGEVVGYQSLDLWSPLLSSMLHVGQLGTFLLPEWRRRGVGHALFDASRSFARSSGYRKLVIHVRGSNIPAQMFYQQLGFVQCGRLARQVVVDGQEDDEILMELFL